MAPGYYNLITETTILWPGETGAPEWGAPEWLPAITVLIRNFDFVAGIGGGQDGPQGANEPS